MPSCQQFYADPYTNNNGRFKELAKIGEGAFGEVYVGIDHQQGSFVAIKNVRLMNPSKGKMHLRVYIGRADIVR